MTTIRFRSPVAKPLHRSDWQRPAGNTDFRVTQRFGDIDYYWKDIDPARAALGHRATDIGNARCGEPILAMMPGTITLLRDNATALGAPTDALGVRVTNGALSIECWHLDSWSVANGARVAAGTVIGKLGSTGLGSVCHCHIELKIDGVRRDAEPYMFGAVYSTEGSDMPVFGGADFEHWRREYTALQGARFRDEPTLTANIRETLGANTPIISSIRVKGATANGSDDWVGAWLYVDSRWRLGFLHVSTVHLVERPPTPTPTIDAEKIAGHLGAAIEQLAAATRELSQ